jgi:osmotically-inducible protein OsmY
MKIHLIAALFAVSAIGLACGNAHGQTNNASDSVGTTAPDNSRANKLEASDRTTTADAQKNDKSDLQITRQIRKGVIADKSLSTYAHNVKIVSLNGTVTLNGVVRTEEDKDSVARIAAQVVGEDHIVNKIKIAPKSDGHD